MTSVRAERQRDLLDALSRFCELTLPENSIYVLLNWERDVLFPDEMFTDRSVTVVGAVSRHRWSRS